MYNVQSPKLLLLRTRKDKNFWRESVYFLLLLFVCLFFFRSPFSRYFDVLPKMLEISLRFVTNCRVGCVCGEASRNYREVSKSPICNLWCMYRYFSEPCSLQTKSSCAWFASCARLHVLSFWVHLPSTHERQVKCIRQAFDSASTKWNRTFVTLRTRALISTDRVWATSHL